MAEDFKPRPITRKELGTFLPNMRAIKAFEKLFDEAYKLSDIQTILSVSNIDNPSELNTISGTKDGYLCVVVEENEATIYSYSSLNYPQDAPYIMSGLTGSWTAVAGKYSNLGKYRRAVTTSVNYTIQPNDDIIIALTDTGDITLSLQAGIDGESHTVKNIGVLDNIAVISPNGVETIFGETIEEVYNGEVLDFSFESTTYWN